MTKRGVSKHQRGFLAAFKSSASIIAAAAAVGIDRGLHYQWLASDPEYPARFLEARDEAAQTLEDEAVRRAHVGVDEPVIYQGALCFPWIETVDPVTGETANKRSDQPLVIRKHSDALLMFLLKGARPEKYRETWKGEISGPGGGPIPLEQQRLAVLDDDQLASLIAIARQLAAAGADGSRAGETRAE